jgi:hypothetical protein
MAETETGMQQLQGSVVFNVIQNLLVRVLLSPKAAAPQTGTAMQVIWMEGGVFGLNDIIIQ